MIWSAIYFLLVTGITLLIVRELDIPNWPWMLIAGALVWMILPLVWSIVKIAIAIGFVVLIILLVKNHALKKGTGS